MALRNPRTLQWVPSGAANCRVESAPSMIGPITLGAKSAGQRSAGNPPAPLDEAGTGNGGDDQLERDTLPKGEKQHGLARSKRPPRQSSTLPGEGPGAVNDRGYSTNYFKVIGDGRSTSECVHTPCTGSNCRWFIVNAKGCCRYSPSRQRAERSPSVRPPS